ncbi:MAG: M23 family metallopeptidase [Ilumatobacteraceae bacterium]
MIAAFALVVALVGGPCYPPPVAAPIAEPYVQPACDYCPGHRGVEYHLAANTPVTAVADGTVTFAGAVAGTRYVVVLQPNGWKATYGMLAATSVSRGDVVRQGQLIGRSSTRLYFGFRDAADRPVDPTPLLGQVVGRPRLVPADGRSPRAGPPPRRVCTAVPPSGVSGAGQNRVASQTSGPCGTGPSHR